MKFKKERVREIRSIVRVWLLIEGHLGLFLEPYGIWALVILGRRHNGEAGLGAKFPRYTVKEKGWTNLLSCSV